MKRLSETIGYLWVLFVLITVALCGVNIAFLAAAGNHSTTSDTQGQLVIPNIDEASNAYKYRDQRQIGLTRSSNRSLETGEFSALDVPNPRTAMADSEGNLREGTEIPDSSFKQYLLLAIVIGTVGLVMIAAGVIQWWLQRSIRQSWLFPRVQEDEEPGSPTTSAPTPLIAKKHAEVSPQDEVPEKRTRRRAA